MKTAYFNRFEIRMSDRAVIDIARPGDADADVRAHLPGVQFSERATPDAIRAELAEYGAWDEAELADDEANKRRIVWCAANDIREEENQNYN